MERTPFTKEGFERLKKELETLEKVDSLGPTTLNVKCLK